MLKFLFLATLIFLILWNLGRFFARMAGRSQNSRTDGADRFNRPDESPFGHSPWQRGLREKDVTDQGRIIEEKNGDPE